MNDSNLSNEQKIEFVKQVVTELPPSPVAAKIDDTAIKVDKQAVDPDLTTEKEIEQKLVEFREEEKQTIAEPEKPVELDPRKVA